MDPGARIYGILTDPPGAHDPRMNAFFLVFAETYQFEKLKKKKKKKKKKK